MVMRAGRTDPAGCADVPGDAVLARAGDAALTVLAALGAERRRRRPRQARSVLVVGGLALWSYDAAEAPMTRRDVVVLGSTGSIGTQALDLVRANPDRFRVVGLTAGGSNPDLFERAGRRVRARRSPGSARTPPPRPPAMACDVVLNGITGAVGLRPTLAALDAGTTLALANKESLIIGGPLVTRPRPARPDRARRLRAQRDRPVPARRLRRGGTPPRADRQRRPVPRPDAASELADGHARAGAGPPQLRRWAG